MSNGWNILLKWFFLKEIMCGIVSIKRKCLYGEENYQIWGPPFLLPISPWPQLVHYRNRKVFKGLVWFLNFLMECSDIIHMMNSPYDKHLIPSKHMSYIVYWCMYWSHIVSHTFCSHQQERLSWSLWSWPGIWDIEDATNGHVLL